MGITKNYDVMEALRILTEDGNKIFMQDINEYDMRDVKIKERQDGTWDLTSIDGEALIEGMCVAYFGVSDKILSFCYRLRGENKEERKTIKLWF